MYGMVSYACPNCRLITGFNYEDGQLKLSCVKCGNRYLAAHLVKAQPTLKQALGIAPPPPPPAPSAAQLAQAKWEESRQKMKAIWEEEARREKEKSRNRITRKELLELLKDVGHES